MIKIGDVEVRRVEEIIIYEPMALFADFRPEALAQNRHWLEPHSEESRGCAKMRKKQPRRSKAATISNVNCSFTRARHGDDVVARIDEVDFAGHPFREA